MTTQSDETDLRPPRGRGTSGKRAIRRPGTPAACGRAARPSVALAVLATGVGFGATSLARGSAGAAPVSSTMIPSPASGPGAFVEDDDLTAQDNQSNILAGTAQGLVHILSGPAAAGIGLVLTPSGQGADLRRRRRRNREADGEVRGLGGDVRRPGHRHRPGRRTRAGPAGSRPGDGAGRSPPPRSATRPRSSPGPTTPGSSRSMWQARSPTPPSAPPAPVTTCRSTSATSSACARPPSSAVIAGPGCLSRPCNRCQPAGSAGRWSTWTAG